LAEGTAIEDLLHADRVLIGGKQTESGLKPFNLWMSMPIGCPKTNFNYECMVIRIIQVNG
jgi:hypothetical protein